MGATAAPQTRRCRPRHGHPHIAILLATKLPTNGTLKVYPGFDHGICTTHADVINADLLALVKG